jgi:predicted  nucleic acid-binding Zn-ribbon protein
MDCPNCGHTVDEKDVLCPNCGFDLHSQVADEVRRLREEGRIHPGQLGASNDDWEGGDPRERDIHEELPSEDWGGARENPEEREAGM